uniref:WSC domain-containing protein n=1 Tax=Chrysotila carterae TaxID=13221 RepID=A0A7S4BP66_CHRCT
MERQSCGGKRSSSRLRLPWIRFSSALVNAGAALLNASSPTSSLPSSSSASLLSPLSFPPSSSLSSEAITTARPTLHSFWLEPPTNSSARHFGANFRALAAKLGIAPFEQERLSMLAEEIHRAFRHSSDARPKWQGCFQDMANDRDVTDGPAAFGHSSQACAAACTGWPYFALQGGGQCFCGDAFSRTPNHSKLGDAMCGRVCPGEDNKLPTRYCGGGWRNAVYAAPSAMTSLFGLQHAPRPNRNSTRKWV